MIANFLSLGIAMMGLQTTTTGTNIPGYEPSSPVHSGSPTTEEINGGDKIQADRDARAFAKYRAEHPEMSYDEAFYSFAWGGGNIP